MEDSDRGYGKSSALVEISGESRKKRGIFGAALSIRQKREPEGRQGGKRGEETTMRAFSMRLPLGQLFHFAAFREGNRGQRVN